MSLRSYIITRLLLTIPMIMFLLTLVFMILRIIPGDPALLHFEKNVDPQVLEEFRHRLGLDKPPLEQYFEYLGGLLQGNFGLSMYDYSSVSTHITQRFPATLELTMYSMLFAVGVGVFLGVKSSKKYNKPTDTSIRLFGIVTYAIPVFFFGMILQMIFAIGLHWLPTGGRFNSRYDPPSGPIVELGLLTLNMLIIVGIVVFLGFFATWYRTREENEERSNLFWILTAIPILSSFLLPTIISRIAYKWWNLVFSAFILINGLVIIGIVIFFGGEQLSKIKSRLIAFQRSGYLIPFVLMIIFVASYRTIINTATNEVILSYLNISILIFAMYVIIGYVIYVRWIHVVGGRMRNVSPSTGFSLIGSAIIIFYESILSVLTNIPLLLSLMLLMDIIFLFMALLKIKRRKTIHTAIEFGGFWRVIFGTILISFIIPFFFLIRGAQYVHSEIDLTTGLYTIDSLLSGDWWSLGQSFMYLILPSVTLGTVLCGIFIRLTRTNMLETLRTDFVVAGEARGLSDRTITYGYALRNAFLPIMTMIGLQFAALLAGAVLTETTFNWRGLGTYLVSRIGFRDYTGIQGTVVFFGVFVTMVTLVMDILYAYMDPRIRL